MDIKWLFILFLFELCVIAKGAIEASANNICKGTASLKITCSVQDIQSNLDHTEIITLSKDTPNSVDLHVILLIRLVYPNRTITNWFDDDLKIRGSLEDYSLFPPLDARLVFTIDGSHLETSDGGVYKCTFKYKDKRGINFTEISIALVNVSNCNNVTEALGNTSRSTGADFLVWMTLFVALGSLLIT